MKWFIVASVVFCRIVYSQPIPDLDSISIQLEAVRTFNADDDSLQVLIQNGLNWASHYNSREAKLLQGEFLYEQTYLHYKRSQYQDAISSGIRSLQLAKELADSLLLQKICYQLGNTYAKIGSEFSTLDDVNNRKRYAVQGRLYLDRAIALAKSMGDTSLVQQSYIGLANLYLSQKQYDSAVYFSRGALNLTSFQAHKIKATALNILGIISFEIKDYGEAERNFEQAIVEARQVPGSLVLLSAMGNLANVYMEQKRYSLAIKKLHDLMRLNNQAGRRQALSKNYITLHTIFKRQKQYDSSLHYFEKYIAVRDSILSDRNKIAIKELEVKYESEKKNKAISELELQRAMQQAEIQRMNFFIVMTLLVSIFLIVLLLMFFRQRIIRQKQQNAEIRQRLLTAQLNPHFMFNALNSIQRLYIDGKIEDGNIFMSNFAQFMRDILNKTSRVTIPLYEELSFLKAYLNLEQKRLGNRFEFSIHVASELENSSIEVPTLISQPLVENALVHGILRKGENGFITIEVNKEVDNTLTFRISDNGVGYSNSLQHKKSINHNSKGLELIRKRLGRRGRLIIETLRGETGTMATLKLQID